MTVFSAHRTGTLNYNISSQEVLELVPTLL